MFLVTGALGHLGANLVRRLLDDGHAVRVLLHRPDDTGALNGLDVERISGDLRDPAACRAAVRGCEGIHHCAAIVSTIDGNARHRQAIFENNVLGTRNLLRAARDAGGPRVVVTGSFSAVGHEPRRPGDETMPFNPFERHLPYAFTKAAVEHECLKAFADGLPVVVATSCAILGPNDFKPSRLGRVLCDVANGRMRMYVRGGFEFVAAQDMVQGHMLCFEKGRPGQKYIFSTQFLTVDELLDIFADVTGQARPKICLPGPLMAGLAEVADRVLRFFPGVPRRFTPAAIRILRMHRRADTTKARTELGFRPSSIPEAVRAACEFFVRQGRITLPRKAAVPAGQGLEITT